MRLRLVGQVGAQLPRELYGTIRVVAFTPVSDENSSHPSKFT